MKRYKLILKPEVLRNIYWRRFGSSAADAFVLGASQEGVGVDMSKVYEASYDRLYKAVQAYIRHWTTVPAFDVDMLSKEPTRKLATGVLPIMYDDYVYKFIDLDQVNLPKVTPDATILGELSTVVPTDAVETKHPNVYRMPYNTMSYDPLSMKPIDILYDHLLDQ